tara:strand:- start:455 stop:682 length:228 start_codon:yes stop_codon:yes gene_type:complete
MTEALPTPLTSVTYKDNHFLLMREKPAGKIIYNQPVGHLEPAEYLIAEAERAPRRNRPKGQRQLLSWHLPIHLAT